MLRLPSFDVLAPSSVDEVLAILAVEGQDTRLVAGGTDLLPNLKHRLAQPDVLISLHGVASLREMKLEDDALVIGAGVTLATLAHDERLRDVLPSLATAAGCVAGPAIRNTATLGGNLHLDTRCRWVNQSDFWRSSLGGCLKSDGDVCHVVQGGKRCVAALSSDIVPVLISLDATLELASVRGRRTVALADYYQNDGVAHTGREPDELLTSVRVPLPEGPRRSAYVKWRVRNSIDFPLVSVAVRIDLTEDEAAIAQVRVVAGVLGAKPKVIGRLDEVKGDELDAAAATLIAEAVHDQCKPLPNVPGDAEHRREMIRVLTRRTIEALADE